MLIWAMRAGSFLTIIAIGFSVLTTGCDRRGAWERHYDESAGNYKSDPAYEKLNPEGRLFFDTIHEAAKQQAKEADRKGIPYMEVPMPSDSDYDKAFRGGESLSPSR